MELKEALTWIFAGPGAGVLSYHLLKGWAWYHKVFSGGHKRVVAMVATGLLAVLAYIAAYLMLYLDAPPTTVREWVGQLFVVASSAIVAAQVVHGYNK